MRHVLLIMGALLFVAVPMLPASGFMVGGPGGEGCGAGECKDCHSLSVEEARTVLQGIVDEVNGVRFSEVGGLWEVDVVKRGRALPIYLDYSKQFIVSGQVVRIATKENLTEDRFRTLNTVDPASVPLDDAIVVGDPDAPLRVVVFDDPVCPFCKKLHLAMKDVVKRNPAIAFYIKMFPLTKIHPDAYQKAKAIVCERSGKLLELSLEGGPVPAPTCETDQIDKNIALAAQLGIRTTPTVILPDGLVVPGFREAEALEQMIVAAGQNAAGQDGKPAP